MLPIKLLRVGSWAPLGMLTAMVVSACVCVPRAVEVGAPQVAASMPVGIALASSQTEVGRDVVIENASWIIAFAVGWPMLCVLIGFAIYMLSNRIPAILAWKDRVKGRRAAE